MGALGGPGKASSCPRITLVVISGTEIILTEVEALDSSAAQHGKHSQPARIRNFFLNSPLLGA